MKPSKGLSSDHKKLEQPPGTYPFGKNGVWNANTNSIQNEKGFRLSSVQFPYQINGIIETDSNPIVFSTNNIYSAFGFYNEETDTYIPIEDDQYKSYKLTFRTDKYIIGEARRNYKNNLEIAWLDKYNPVRFADTSALPDSLTGYLIFPEYRAPDIEVDVVNGGTLGLGAYMVAAKYLSSDGTETRYSNPTVPVFATAPNFAAIPGSSTGKSLKIVLINLDSQYDEVQVAIIRRIKGVTSVVELPAISITEPLTIQYTGTEGEEITLEEVLIPAAFYDNAGSITQLEDVLWLADIQESQLQSMQKYANMAQLRFKSVFQDDIENNDNVKSGKVRTQKHGEVYAAYLVYRTNKGQFTDGFHIPGVAPVLSDLEIDPTVNFVAYRFQTDTRGLSLLNTTDKTGRPGVWVNEETYPNIDEFNSSGLGGEDLRGKRVRHHKMPTINQMANLFYPTNGNYGIKGLDALGITVENIIIPPELVGIITGYEVYFAKRDVANSTIISQGLVINPGTTGYTGGDLYFTGGNFNSRLKRSDSSGSDGNRFIYLNNGWGKIHHPDIMITRPGITPDFVASQLRLHTDTPPGNVILTDEDEMNFISDFYRGYVYNKTYTVKGIDNTGFLLNNASKGPVRNIKSEDGYLMGFKGSGLILNNIDLLERNGRDTEGDEHVPNFEEAHLVDLSVVKNNVYSGFINQDLVRTGVINSIDLSIPRKYAFSGDCFLVLHSYYSYGLTDSIDRFASNPGRVDGMSSRETDTYTDEYYYGSSGVKVIRRYVTESTYNMWQRYVDPALDNSKFWTISAPDTVNGMDRNRDNNSIAISQEATAVGDLLNGVQVYNYNDINITSSPYKVIRSTKQAREGKTNSWKNFNPLDYYETEKNMGPIINILGYNGRLIIHHRNALFITEDKTTLTGDILNVTLGSGDIFRLPPKPGKPSKTGYAGTQHQLACKLTDYGYIFPDAERGLWFVLNDEGLNEINLGMYNFMEEYLNVKEINPYIGNGICIGYDHKLKRLLVTVKNQRLGVGLENYVPNYEETTEFFSKLTAGVSIVFKDGRYQRFLGENTSEFSCIVYPAPVLGNFEFTIQENSPTGLYVGEVTATGDGALSFQIISGNINSAFSIDPLSGKIYVVNQAALKYNTNPEFELTVKVIDTHGGSDTGIVTINLTEVNLPPVTQDYIVNINEDIPVDTVVQDVEATDPKGLPLTYSILSQSVAGAVKINSTTGVVSVNTAAAFDFEINTIIEVVVRVSNGTLFADSNIRIFIEDTNEPPIVENKDVLVNEDATGVVMIYTAPIDPEGLPMNILVVSQSSPGAFVVNTVTREVSVAPGYTLNVDDSPYTINMKAREIGTGGLESDFVLTINLNPPVPVCPDRVLVFQICNNNASRDDNFDVYLNNTKIGEVDLNADAQIGSVFIASDNDDLEIVSSDFTCPLEGMVVYFFSPALVLGGANEIIMINTQDNGNSNAGTVGIRNYLVTDNDLSAPCVVDDLVYSGSSGSNFNLPFSYTACCPEDEGS